MTAAQADLRKASRGSAATNASAAAAAGSIKRPSRLERVLILTHRPPGESRRSVSPQATPRKLGKPTGCARSSQPQAGNRWEGAAAAELPAHANRMRKKRTAARAAMGCRDPPRLGPPDRWVSAAPMRIWACAPSRAPGGCGSQSLEVGLGPFFKFVSIHAEQGRA